MPEPWRGGSRWAWALLALGTWAALPLVASRHVVDLLVFAGLYSIAGLGVSFLLGRSGIVTLAQAAFYGVGAYSVAFFGARLGLPSPVGLAAGAAISAAIASAVGWPVLRLTGYFLALATLALGIIGNVLFLEWAWLTGGTLGIGGLPSISLLGWELGSPARFYYFVWPVVLLAMWLLRNLIASREGLAMRAMRDAPDAAAVLGVDVHGLKVRVFVLSAVFGSVAGAFFAHYVSFISVHSFGVDRAISFLLLAVLGGVYTVWGAVLGALFVTLVPEALSRFGDIHALLFALTLIAAVIVLPEGFGGAIESALARRRGRPVGDGRGTVEAPRPWRGGPWNATPAPAGSPAAPLLDIRSVFHSFRGLQVLADVSITVPAGSIVGLIGPNGSGKTTLFNVVSGFLAPERGAVLYDGRDVTRDTVQRRSRAGLVRTFQTPKVFPSLTVFDNLTVGAYKETGSGIVAGMGRLPRSRRDLARMREKAEWACERFGLTPVRHVVAGSLSGGEQRLVELARAWVSEPRLLLLDEPSSGLTAEEIERMMATLRELNAEGLSILLVSHHMDLVSVASEINVLNFGQIIARGPLAAVQGDVQVREAYLGV